MKILDCGIIIPKLIDKKPTQMIVDEVIIILFDIQYLDDNYNFVITVL